MRCGTHLLEQDVDIRAVMSPLDRIKLLTGGRDETERPIRRR
ncbi:hypothetical protein [Aminobacter sp. MSH1]